MDSCPGKWIAGLCLLALLLAPEDAKADKRPPHLIVQTGIYGALGSPSSWGPSLSLDILPGSLAGRWGMRAEYRGYQGYSEGSVLVGALFEAGATRPHLALKLSPFVGMTDEKAPIVGGGVNWSLWALGPLGVSSFTDLQVIIDGSDTRPALTTVLSLHIGR